MWDTNFLKLLDRCFPKGHKLHKILNRNTVKLNYSCSQNLQLVINGHNAKINKKLHNENDPPLPECKCGENPCILQEGCHSENIVYQATLTEENGQKHTYVGLCSPPFYTRFRNHRKSFNNRNYSTETELSKCVWNLKDRNVRYDLSWKIVDRGKPYDPHSKSCQLCLKEKYIIIFKPEYSTLNTRDEIASTCRHRTHSL